MTWKFYTKCYHSASVNRAAKEKTTQDKVYRNQETEGWEWMIEQ